MAMTKREALKELRLNHQSPSEQEIKKAYRKRSLETHPDKGGSKEEFIRVAEAYQILTGQAQESSSSGFGGGGTGGFNMPDEEKMRMATEMFFEMFDEFLVDTNVAADKVVDWIFDVFHTDNFEKTTTQDGRTSYQYTPGNSSKKKDKKEDTRFQSIFRWGVRKGISFLQSIMEGDNAKIVVNGQTITGADFKKFRQQAQQRVAAKNKHKTDGEF